MDAQQREFCQFTTDYVQGVVSCLARHIGPKAALAQVMQHLKLVLESMFEGMLCEDMAWSLIPQPHNVPMPGSAA